MKLESQLHWLRLFMLFLVLSRHIRIVSLLMHTRPSTALLNHTLILCESHNFMAVRISILVIWVMTLCSLVGGHQRCKKKKNTASILRTWRWRQRCPSKWWYHLSDYLVWPYSRQLPESCFIFTEEHTRVHVMYLPVLANFSDPLPSISWPHLIMQWLVLNMKPYSEG
jgi:hypothetical protein